MRTPSVPTRKSKKISKPISAKSHRLLQTVAFYSDLRLNQRDPPIGKVTAGGRESIYLRTIHGNALKLLSGEGYIANLSFNDHFVLRFGDLAGGGIDGDGAGAAGVIHGHILLALPVVHLPPFSLSAWSTASYTGPAVVKTAPGDLHRENSFAPPWALSSR